MEKNILVFLKNNTGIKNEKDILSKYQEEYINKTYSENDKIIGHVAANKRNLNYYGNTLKACFIIDSVVIEERRQEGIYTNLYREFEKDLDAEILYSMPLQYELLNLVDKQGYRIIGEAKAYAKIIDPSKVVKVGPLGFIAKVFSKMSDLKSKSIPYEGYRINEDIDFNDIDILYDKVKDDFGFMSQRSGNWIQSRINKRDNYKFVATYKDGIAGYILYKIVERADIKYFMIMDILFQSEEALESMYDYLYNKAKNEKVNLIGTWQSSKTAALIKNKKFQDARSSFPFVVKSEIEATSKMENWYLQPIEGETY